MIEHSTLVVWEYRYMVRSNREMNYLLGNTIHAMMQINRRERESEREKRGGERERQREIESDRQTERQKDRNTD